MLDVKTISATIENFFLCTHIPIKAIGINGHLIHSAGYEDQLESLFNHNNIYENIKDKLIGEDSLSLVHINCSGDIKFTASHICPKHKDFGFYVIGPYISEMTKDAAVIYKPSFCIPHIISLLHNIGSGITLVKTDDSNAEKKYSLFVKKAINYIQNNYEQPITLEEIARHININKSYFCTLFKKETGKTYSQYLNEFRIERSKVLLQDKSLSILDISLSVGFNSQNYYNMTFKKLTNKTPLEFRNSINDFDSYK